MCDDMHCAAAGKFCKRVIILVGVLGAAVFVAKKIKTANEERALWREATTAPDLR